MLLRLALLGLILLPACGPEADPVMHSLVIHSVTLADGDGTRGPVTLVIDGERITAVADDLDVPAPAARTVLDGTGKWVVPGFIDIHVHDAGEPYQRTMLAWGITAVQLMPHEAPDSPTAMERTSEKTDSLVPRRQITPMFTTEFPDNLFPGAYQFSKPASADAARQAVRDFHGRGYRQIKIIHDDGVLWAGEENAAPLMPEEIFAALAAEAHALGMRVYVHTTQRRDTLVALAAAPEALIHGTMDTALAAGDWQRMTDAGTVLAPTYHALHWYGDRRAYARRLLGDPRLTAFLPQEEEALLQSQAGEEAPLGADLAAAYQGASARNTEAALAAGVVIAVGSDGGPAGASTHLEMELMQENGMSPAQVLAAATHGGAVALGRADELGGLEPGMRADLVLLTADPLADIRNCRQIEMVVKGGVAHRPRDLAAAE